MIILLAVVILMFICAASVIAAGMLSSRLSRREQWVEVYNIREPLAPEGEPLAYK
ncbi:MAG: hypothetical protein R3293_03005 [Candidatus Promineifilaceae bacterium]|nr:hypothetical protein [Candidatus Promineifilaceae bacterium]